MARGRREIPPCSKTYGFPNYCAAWVPLDRISAAGAAMAEVEEKEDKSEVAVYCAAWVPLDRISAAGIAAAEAEEKEDKSEVAVEEEKEDKDKKGGGEGEPSALSQLLAALGIGGGQGRSGVPNALVISEFDLAKKFVVHPGGEGILHIH